jgi:hypothetical protein
MLNRASIVIARLDFSPHSDFLCLVEEHEIDAISYAFVPLRRMSRQQDR